MANFNSAAAPTFRGSLASVTNLPLQARHGDTYLIGGEMYMYMHGNWVKHGFTQGPTGVSGYETSYTQKEIIESKLIWKGISVTLHSVDDIKDLFSSQYNLTKEDMAMFQMTYPDHFKEFRQKWAEKWAIETAKNEFDSWSDDYYEKKQRRNYS